MKLPTACVLNLIGTQGYGKTTLARNFCALYNGPDGRVADFYDAQSTAASMRNALNEAKDRVVVIDDLCKSTSRQEMRMRQDLIGRILRSAANESSTSKMVGGETVNYLCLCGLAITGEITFEMPSEITRCVIVNVDRPLRNSDPDERIFAATAAAYYIQWMCVHFAEELEHLKHCYQNFSANDTSKNIWRLKKSLFQLDWVFDNFLRFAKNAGAIGATAQQQLQTRAANIFQGIFTYEESLQQRLENSQPSRWRELILEGARKKAFPYQMKPGCICVKPKDLVAYLKMALCDSSLEELEMNRHLKEQHLLLMDKSGKSTKKVSNIRMLNINISS